MCIVRDRARRCSLLTQEHAKKFLHNGNEEDRYQFFLQAANMASRKLDLLSAQQSIDLQFTRCDRDSARRRLPPAF